MQRLEDVRAQEEEEEEEEEEEGVPHATHLLSHSEERISDSELTAGGGVGCLEHI